MVLSLDELPARGGLGTTGSPPAAATLSAPGSPPAAATLSAPGSSPTPEARGVPDPAPAPDAFGPPAQSGARDVPDAPEARVAAGGSAGPDARGALDTRAAALAAGQAGCTARWQALRLGFTDRMLRHRLTTGRWRRLHPGVYVVGGAPESWLQDVWAAALAVGERVTVTHETALLLAGVVTDERVARYPIVLTAPHGSHPRVAGAVVHQIDDVRAGHLVTVEGLRASRPARAIVDIAATAGERYIAGLVDHLLIERHTTMAALAACFNDVARPGKPGIAKLARVLDSRGPGYVPPHSELEDMLLSVLAAAGLPAPERQIQLPCLDDTDGRADAGYRDARVLLEADGRRWHTRLADFARDRRRDAATARAGWLTLRFTHDELAGDPEGVAATVRDVREVRLVQLSVPAVPLRQAS